MKKILGPAIKRLHIRVGDGPCRRDASFMLDHAKVFGPHAKHSGAEDFGLAAHEIRLLGMQWFAVLILPGFFGVVAVVQEDRGCVPIKLLLRHEGAALQNEDLLAGLGEVQGQCSTTRPSADHDRIKVVCHAHLEHGIRVPLKEHLVSFSDWLVADIERPESAHGQGDKSKHPWWHVMCLTGVDYFSTLGYQSGIAFLAAGVLSPVATLVLVMVTLCAALPVYNRVAAASPYGQGSIAMLEKLFPGWTGKGLVLVLLGFATTDFIITMTLSAADAAAHFVHNPYTPPSLQSQMGVTLMLLAILGAVFLKGFKEAIDISVVLVGVYLALNLIVCLVGLFHVLVQPHVVVDWKRAVFAQHGSLVSILGLSCLLFPRLALGLSGFETGVAVMPLIECDNNLEVRIFNTRRLLATAAII